MTSSSGRLSRLFFITIASALVLLVVAIFLIGRRSLQQELEFARPVANLEAKQNVGELQSCLGYKLSVSKFWTESPGTHEVTGINHMTHLGIRIRDLGGVRSVVLSTRNGRELRPGERAAITDCISAKD